MRTRRCLSLGGGVLAALAALIASSSVLAQPNEVPKEVLAVQLRKQGFTCKTPIHAERDADAAYGDAVWVLTCDTGRYRMRLIPNMAAKIEKLPDKDQDQSNQSAPSGRDE